MADGADLIDIYAEEEFVQESEFAAEQVDLYDDVLAASSHPSAHHDLKGGYAEPPSPIQSAVSRLNNKPPAILYTYNNLHKKSSIYIGNFSWWTTDQQIFSAIRSAGVREPVELKFAENRANGQSKGYAEVLLSSEIAMNQLLEHLPQKTVNGEKLDVRPANRQNLSFFEAIARKKIPPRANSKGSLDNLDGTATPAEVEAPIPRPEAAKNILPFYVRPAFMENPSRVPVMNLQRPPFSIPPPMAAAYRAPPLPLMQYPHLMPPPPRLPPPLGMPPPNTIPPALHLNPAFFPPPPPNSLLIPPPDSYKLRTIPYMHSRDLKGPPLNVSEAEFEELMNRNRAISRSALSNAVSGATSGDYSNAIKTLETAIAVIKESRVANDERCRVLLNSLRDCLHGIQDKANSTRKRHRSRDRSPSRSREGSSRRHRDSHDDRSEDYYHERHRDKDRHR
uniref:Cleavage and polyadenylation specific factor 7 n=1 Tax=Leptobrachium leishanense TaxID=445787 RepID=A0A8C5WDY5_9ANUR